MPDYKQSDVSGTSWQRCHGVFISNPLGGVPTVALREQRVTQVGLEKFISDMGELSFPFDPSGVIALRNPHTGELVGGTVTQGELYVALWSLYMQKALARDGAQP